MVSSDAVGTVSETEQQAEFLRQIAVTFAIAGLGAGEILDVLTFDGVDVKPAGVVAADSNGELTDDFVIPGERHGRRQEVYAEGRAAPRPRRSSSARHHRNRRDAYRHDD
ncbi:MAG: hypothetical protein IPK28_15250 [Devosia sp.]|nr:hypothetical protein [Devosia sp.]